LTDIDQIAGMTVNERLLHFGHFGLFEAFDSAVASRELLAVVAVLRKAMLTEQQAHDTASAVLANPSYYGLR
jgi:hypothetical protein